MPAYDLYWTYFWREVGIIIPSIIPSLNKSSLIKLINCRNLLDNLWYSLNYNHLKNLIPDNLIDNFSCDEEKFSPYKKNIWINGKEKIFTKGELENLEIKLNFRNTVWCKLFLGENVKGNLIINFQNNNFL